MSEKSLQTDKASSTLSSEGKAPTAKVSANSSVKNDSEDEAYLEKVLASKAPTAMQITKCPHVNRKHYAKNMCSSCYRKFGRNQYATKCGHNDRLLYSMGMCQTCYLADYHQRRTKIKRKLESKRRQATKALQQD